LSEREFARRWRRVTPYLVAILFVVFVIISPILSRKLEPLVNGVLELFPAHYANLEPVPDAEARLEASMKSRQLIAEGFGFQTAAVICLVGYFGFTIVGKKLYRRIAFEKIASEIASRPAIRRSEADNTPAAAAKKDAVPSGFWRILGAGLLDLLIYLVLAVIFTVAAYSMLLSGGAFAAWLNRFDPLGVVVAWFAWLVIVACLYPTLTTWSRLRGTFGDRIFGIRLVTLNEKPLRFLRILARYGTSAVSCAFLGLGFFGFLSQPFTPNRQALVDLIARTRFVRRPKKKKNTIADEALAGSEPAAVPEGA